MSSHYTLSWKPLKCFDDFKCDCQHIADIALIKLTQRYREVRVNFKKLRQNQLNDPCLSVKMVCLEDYDQESMSEKERKIKQRYMVHKRLLFKRGERAIDQYRLCVLKDQIISLFQQQHEDIGQFGETKTWHMRNTFYFSKMQRIIIYVVAPCDISKKCKTSKASKGVLN